MRNEKVNTILKAAVELKPYYDERIKRAYKQIGNITNSIPEKWNVPISFVETKLQQLFESEWVEGVWQNFIECLKENIENE